MSTWVMLGSSTRMACSSSSWPVSSPSRTMMRASAIVSWRLDDPTDVHVVREARGARRRLPALRRRPGGGLLPAGALGAVANAGRTVAECGGTEYGSTECGG